MPQPAGTSASVVVPTYNRPDHVRTCLEHLSRQSFAPERIVVVDASPTTATRDVVRDVPGVTYLRNDRGAGSTATSRAIGVREVTSDVVAFLDDDAFAAEDWLEQLVARYDDPRVGAVGGRALNGQPGEEAEGADRVGLLLDDGSLTGFFAADPGRDVAVDHLLGANMSMRRAALESVGGIEDHYPGTCLREETEPVLRLRLAGWHVVYTPDAVVRHVAGPYAKGRRFDLRYTYYGRRNHVVLLARTVGVGDPRFRRNFGAVARQTGAEIAYAGRSVTRLWTRQGSVTRGVGNGVLRAGTNVAGTLGGLGAVALLGVRDGLRPTEVRGD
ncbi:glycosyltransferase family 2 protein [Cellulosimicrobium sp. PMB13]|uniref:glycosyltransferase family 2 protein n=1 Tax=Cellulosimicrobium sp. PMB13 TaxID=3120158 RepID=UPI003F4AF88E